MKDLQVSIFDRFLELNILDALIPFDVFIAFFTLYSISYLQQIGWKTLISLGPT